MDLSEQVNCPCLASHSPLFLQKGENFRMDAAMPWVLMNAAPSGDNL